MARLDRYRIGIPLELSEIRTQPWLSEGSLTCDPYHHRGPIFCEPRTINLSITGERITFTM